MYKLSTSKRMFIKVALPSHRCCPAEPNSPLPMKPCNLSLVDSVVERDRSLHFWRVHRVFRQNFQDLTAADLEPDQPVVDVFNQGCGIEVLRSLCRGQHRTRQHRIARTRLSTSAGTPRRFAQDRCAAPSSRGGRKRNMRSELIQGAIEVLESDLAFRSTAQVWHECLTDLAYRRLSTVFAPPLGSSLIEHVFRSEQRKCAYVMRTPDQTATQLQTSEACTHSPFFVAAPMCIREVLRRLVLVVVDLVLHKSINVQRSFLVGGQSR